MEATVSSFPLPLSSPLTFPGGPFPASPQWDWDAWLSSSLGGPSGQDVLLGKEKRKAGVKWTRVGRTERMRHKDGCEEILALGVG